VIEAYLGRAATQPSAGPNGATEGGS
jgi:hypothetical protein